MLDYKVEEGPPPEEDLRLDSLPSDFVKCRTSRFHDMDPAGDEVLVESHDGRPLLVRRKWRCDRCGMLRFDTMNCSMWILVGRYYDPPEGYKLDGGAIDPAALRRALWTTTNPTLFAVRKNGGRRRRKAS